MTNKNHTFVLIKTISEETIRLEGTNDKFYRAEIKEGKGKFTK